MEKFPKGFEWDEAKDIVNYQKHGIRFEDIYKIFLRAHLSVLDNRFDYGEDRYICLGEIEELRVTAVYTKRTGIIRIISARPSSRSEREIYDEFRKH